MHNPESNPEEVLFYSRFNVHAAKIQSLYNSLYQWHPKGEKTFTSLVDTIKQAFINRTEKLKIKDNDKEKIGGWFLSNQIVGMSLYVDLFCGELKNLSDKLAYFEKLGVNYLHLMPLFESPKGESDGGYAVSDFKKVDERFGDLSDLQEVVQCMNEKGMYLMTDIIINHTSFRHEWAEKAKQGDPKYQAYFYMYDDRRLPDEFEKYMPDIFPEAAPGSFSYVPECNKWVMSVFHDYQWDLNYTNPEVFVAIMDILFFYANLGVDVLRIDAPAFIWKRLGTSCQNLPEAHILLQLIKQCVQVATPGMALLGEAIVAPKEIMKYFGSESQHIEECDFAYNATQMALQWDSLATGDTRIMLAAQEDLLRKPFGRSWITYTRCHDDIGLAYDDSIISTVGFDPYEHRKYLKEYYSGTFPYSPARGALFAVNKKTQDARISGTLASLCGLESALAYNDQNAIETAINKIILMQAQSMFLGGIPILFYGDELGYTNDYDYLNDSSKKIDNRWMHRPKIDWEKAKKITDENTVESKIFYRTQQLITIRKKLTSISDFKNINWLHPHNIHVAGFIRNNDEKQVYCLFNFKNEDSYVTWYTFKNNAYQSNKLFDHWSQESHIIGADNEYLIIPPYSFCIMEVIG